MGEAVGTGEDDGLELGDGDAVGAGLGDAVGAGVGDRLATGDGDADGAALGDGETDGATVGDGLGSGDAETVSARLREVLSKPPKMGRREVLGSRATAVSGRWEATLEFVLGQASHSLFFEQDGEKLLGTHQTKALSGSLQGIVDENRLEFTSSQSYEGARLRYLFTGEVRGGSMSGEVDLGEYGKARWSAHRYEYA